MKIRAHESFYMRKGWLHKGVKNIKLNNRLFTDKGINPCDILGVGANMVKSIRYWLTATTIMEEVMCNGQRIQQITPFGLLIDKYDKYYEELGTNYLVHYKLATNLDTATAWYWFFNIYDGSTIDREIFAKELNSYIVYSLDEKESKVLDDEYNCLIKTYLVDEKEEDPEETKISPLSELHLLEITDKKKREVKKINPNMEDIHPLIAYAVMCDNLHNRDEIKIDELCSAPCNIGKIFNLNRTSIIGILDKLSKLGYLSIVRTAGLDVININQLMSFENCMEAYYRMLNGEVNL